MLYIVATPIGNLEDISLRALRILKEVDLIACEDTRTTKKLLARYNISTPTISYFQHSQLKKIEYILSQLRKGKNIALVSEAGTPCISDPGVKLIDLAIEQLDDLAIVPIPGPSALIAAASVSGLPVDKFLFAGFPPHKKGRKRFFAEIASSKHTVIFYESPYRILKSLRDLSAESDSQKLKVRAASLVSGQKSLGKARRPTTKDQTGSQDQKPMTTAGKKVVVCRELTKRFETIYRGSTEEVIGKIEKNKVKGEFVVIIEADRRGSKRG